MKPSTPVAMRELIQQVRTALPFDKPDSYLCSGNCMGCSMKLLEFLDMALIDWENRMDRGETPNFGDLHRMADVSKKIYRVLDKNRLITH